MGTVAVICDDLTGAMESALQLKNRNLSVFVMLDIDSGAHLASRFDAVLFVTDSRNIGPRLAALKVEKTYNYIARQGFELVYKKIDSTLRGNIGKEIEVLIAHSKLKTALIAPALPFNGRITRMGHQYLNGKKITETEIAIDPFAPVTDSFIPSILRQQSLNETSIVTVEDLKKGRDHLASLLDGIIDNGPLFCAVDAERDEDLELIASLVSERRGKILPCGSAGLFSKLSALMEPDNAVQSMEHHKKTGPVFVLSGSLSEETKRQLRCAADNGAVLFSLEDSDESLGAEVVAALNEGRDVIVESTSRKREVVLEKYRGKPSALQEMSARLQNAFSRLFDYVIKSADLAGVMIIGGDTLASVCAGQKLHGLEIIGEVEPFIPVGIMPFGETGIPVVTKAGAFGSSDIVIKSMEYLKGN